MVAGELYPEERVGLAEIGSVFLHTEEGEWDLVRKCEQSVRRDFCGLWLRLDYGYIVNDFQWSLHPPGQ